MEPKVPTWNPFTTLEAEAATAKPKRAFELLRDLLGSLAALDPGNKQLFQGKVVAPGDHEKYYPRGLQLAEQLFERLLTGKCEWLHARFEELERGGIPSRVDIDEWRARLPILPVEPLVPTEVDEAVVAQAERLKNLAAKWPGSIQLGPPATVRDVQQARRKHRFWPKGLDAFALACGSFAVARSPNGSDYAAIAMPGIGSVMSFAETVGEQPKKGPLPKSVERLMEHPSRLQLLDVGNGDCVSFVSSATGSELWIDDCADGPNAVRGATFAEVLRWALDDAHFDADGSWTGRWTDFFCQ